AAGALHRTLGRAYQSLGRMREVRPHFTAAVGLLRRAHGPNDPRVADALYDLGEHLTGARDLSAAEAALTEALAIRRLAFGPDDTRVSEVLVMMARGAMQAADLDQADSLLAEAQALRALTTDHKARARVLEAQAEVATARHQPAKAVDLRS